MVSTTDEMNVWCTSLPEASTIHAKEFDPILKDIKVEFEPIIGILRFNTVGVIGHRRMTLTGQ